MLSVMVRGAWNWQSACMMWTGRTDEVAALGLLLDRTYAEVAAAAKRPRLLDREFLIGQFDLWDNHLLPAVAAAAGSLRARRPAARAIWRSLGFHAGNAQRQWMRDHLAGLGFEPEALLGPDEAEPQPFADNAGVLRAVRRRLTPESAALVLADYDLTGGDLEGARMEAVPAEPPHVRGYLALSAGRRLYTAAAAPRPELEFRCEEITSFAFAHAERGAAHLSGQPAIAVTADGGSIAVPASGTDVRLSGRDLSYWPDDSLWHGSAAAGAAARGAHDPGPALPEGGSLPGPLGTLAMLQQLVIWKLRMMRYPERLRRWELAAAGALCAGLGSETIRIASGLGPAALRARAATRRLDTLIETSEGRSRAFLQGLEKHLPMDVPGPPGPPPPAPVRITIGTAGQLLENLDFDGGRLRFVDFAADRRPGQADRTIIHLDARQTPQKPSPHNPTAHEKSTETPTTQTPGAQKTDAQKTDAQKPDAQKTDAQNPDAQNPDAQKPDAQKPDGRETDSRETIVVVVLNEPLGRAPLTVTPEGLTLTGRPRLEATADEIALTIPLPAGDWTARASAGSWYTD
jgi:hypothetical protein